LWRFRFRIIDITSTKRTVAFLTTLGSIRILPATVVTSHIARYFSVNYFFLLTAYQIRKCGAFLIHPVGGSGKTFERMKTIPHTSVCVNGVRTTVHSDTKVMEGLSILALREIYQISNRG
jgi:hypothetical protein